ncbi:hypothetical protein XM74_c21469 [Vibrio vulnificus]|nr:hypothetical protein XM74_c21469 [Vibrio vulnificus]
MKKAAVVSGVMNGSGMHSCNKNKFPRIARLACCQTGSGGPLKCHSLLGNLSHYPTGGLPPHVCLDTHKDVRFVTH